MGVLYIKPRSFSTSRLVYALFLQITLLIKQYKFCGHKVHHAKAVHTSQPRGRKSIGQRNEPATYRVRRVQRTNPSKLNTKHRTRQDTRLKENPGIVTHHSFGEEKTSHTSLCVVSSHVHVLSIHGHPNQPVSVPILFHILESRYEETLWSHKIIRCFPIPRIYNACRRAGYDRHDIPLYIENETTKETKRKKTH